MPAVKPKLERLATPLTATFPSEIASATSATPLSAVHFLCKPDPDFIKTPISPPSAYTDFLSKAMSLSSPVAPSSGETTPESASCPAAAEQSDGSSKTEDDPSPKSTATGVCRAKASAVPPTSPYPSSAPMSAPPTGAASFPSLRLPPSPAMSSFDSPLSASTAARSPFSARSVHSAFDWDTAFKARFSDFKKHTTSRTSVRNIREVVTRTVTYTPRMNPAPRGKRRKVE